MIGIVGGTGLVGSALAMHLEQQQGTDFRLASRNAPLRAQHQARWSKIDLADGVGLSRFLEEVQQVVHLAWSRQPLVSIGGTWRLGYRAAQCNLTQLLYLAPALMDPPFEPQPHYRKEAMLLLRQSGVPTTFIESQPSFEWLLRYCAGKQGVPLKAIPDGKKIAPLPLSQIVETLMNQLSQENTVQRLSVEGDETLSLRDAVQLYRSSGPLPDKPLRQEPSITWENFLAQNLHR